MSLAPSSRTWPRLAAVLALGAALWSTTAHADVQLTAFRQSVAETAAPDESMAAFYRERGFDGFWTGSEAADRRNALLEALTFASAHGLPADRFDPAMIVAALHAADTAAEQGAMEVMLTNVLVDYARAVSTGLLTPSEVDSLLVRDVAPLDVGALLTAFTTGDPRAVLRALPPSSAEYARLMAAKLRLERQMDHGGWGVTVPAGALGPGDSGASVIALRDRLMAMGYLAPTSTRTYDAAIGAAVRRFQVAHGLEDDGEAGAGTIEALNVGPEARLRSVIVAMERERWLGDERGDRHIWVNLADFTAAIIDNDMVTFRTRSVIGALERDRQSPEFSDEMDHMVINPTWYVPRSIVVGQYLPQLQRNASAVGHLRITDSQGRVVNRGSVNFGAYTARTFPFAMQQPPSTTNALGIVKFMFPNQYNIYLHDTPARDLFSHDVRAYSHGCIRLNDPRDFAYVLLARQTDDPAGFFNERLETGNETRVNLDVPVPVHLDYRTAFTDVTGALQHRPDVYGRDATIWEALAAEGVEIPTVSG